MYLISEFSKITNLTIKTLHYYDKEGLLIPYKRDSQTGYRYYNLDNFKRAQQLTFLRSLDFSISEIKELTTDTLSQDDLYYILKEKQQQIQTRITLDQQKNQLIEHHLSVLPTKVAKQLSSSIQLGNMASQLVLAMDFQGPYHEIGPSFKALYAAAQKERSGPAILALFDDSYQEVATIKACLPIKKQWPLKNAKMSFWNIPEQRVLIMTHHGPYNKLNTSYKALIDFAKDRNLTLQFPSYERYLKGPGPLFKGNPENYQTEIMLPYQKA